MLRKVIVLLIISLFIGQILVSSIHSKVINNKDENLVKIEVEICGLKRDKYSVFLTEEMANNVDKLFIDMKSKLENGSNTNVVFNDAVVQLNKYGILRGISVEETQRLINTIYQNKNIQNYLEKNNKIQDENISNKCCFIIGRATEVLSFSLMGNLFKKLMDIFSKYDMIEYLFAILIFLSFIPSTLLPFIIGSSISFGRVRPPLYEHETYKYYPSNGWIYTVGLNGIKKWNETFYGQIGYFPGVLVPSYDYYIGANGFIGIKINKIKDKVISDTFLLGTALKVAIGSNHL